MARKKLILTQRQLDEICGDNSTYLDGLALTPDLSSNYSNEITTNGDIEDAYPEPITTDDLASDMTNNTRGYWGLRGMGSVSTIREVTKKDWEKEFVVAEDNLRLKNRVFGTTNDEEGKSYDATKKNISRYNIAAQKAKSGTPEEKQKALKTMQKMQKNWGGLNIARNQYETAKAVDKQINPGIKSAPKNAGNGKAHTKKTPENGIFTS
jgi:hypothetical protein